MRRNRRAGGVTALILAAALTTASGCGSDSEGPDASAVPVEESPPPTSTEAPTTTDAPGVPSTTIVVDEPTATASGVEVPSPFGTAPDDPDFVPVQWLVPWDGGFLAMGMQYPPAALPEELPPEIAELFPPEVVDLFPDGLPPTQQEAMSILEDVGLLDVVMAVVDEHPEALDALMSVPQSAPMMVATWSADGEAWSSLEVTLPDGFGVPAQVAVLDDRLTIAGSTLPYSVVPFPRWVSVATTTDLEEWVTDGFEIELPTELPESVDVYSDVDAVAANDDGWVARVVTDAFIDPTQLLPDSVRELGEESDVGVGVDPDGVTIERYEDGTATSVERYTWEELDIAPELLPYVRRENTSMTMWAGRWGGQPESTLLDDRFGGTLLATTAGFVDVGEAVRVSEDGIDWTDVEVPQPNLAVDAAAPLGDGVLALTRNAADEITLYSFDPAGATWTALDAPIEGGAHTWSQSSSPAFLPEMGLGDPAPERVVVEHEGYELTLTYGAVESYRLVDESTGETVLEETIDLTVTQAPPGGPFQHLVDDVSGVTITDPASGDVIVTVPHSVIGAAWSAVQVADPGEEPPWPDWWVLATRDGETWLLGDYDEGDGTDPIVPLLVATNDDVALVGSQQWEPMTTFWHRFPMPE